MPEDAGQYQCEVYDDVREETAMSPIFTLVVGSGIPVAGLVGLVLAVAATSLIGAAQGAQKKITTRLGRGAGAAMRRRRFFQGRLRIGVGGNLPGTASRGR